jgi:cyanuric acid amidohydrolase
LIDHDVMKDAIDADAARRVLGRLGGEVVAVLAKAEAAPSGEIRGRRHTMLDDSDIHSTRHARGTLVLGAAGDVEHRVADNAGQDAAHQRAGGAPVAIIGKVP